MKDFSLHDKTQLEILKHLEETQHLMECTLQRVSGRTEEVGITVLPDLGLPHNITRIRGGFYTGMYIKWESSVPFVPVDATINACGVGLYELNHAIESKEEFFLILEKGRQRVEEKGYIWNFNEGNHFITYGFMDGNKPCVVLHSSAKEFKVCPNKNLYPDKNCWYYNNIKIYEDLLSNRYLRYIEGREAEKFYEIAKEAHVFNTNRQHNIAEILFGNKGVNEVINLQHYGMPSACEVAIGCSWNTEQYILLTAPNKPFFLVGCNKKDIVPHGFGVISSASSPEICYMSKAIKIDNEIYESGKIKKEKIRIRNQDLEVEEIFRKADYISKLCNGKIISTVEPVYSYSSNL